MSAFAIIPARGGSKGIPRKNLALCGGRPLVDWVIDAVNNSSEIVLAVLSSDDDEILSRAKGVVEAQKRPFALSTDTSSTEATMRHVYDSYAPVIASMNREFMLQDGNDLVIDTIVLIQPTSPMVTGKDIDRAVEQMKSEGVESVISAVQSHSFVWNSTYAPYNPYNRAMRQAIGKQFEENGAVYATSIRQWEQTHCRMSTPFAVYEMPEETRFQVDTPLDLKIVDLLLRERCTTALT